MIHTSIRMMIPPQKRGEVLRILKSTVEGGKVLPGCLSCHLYEDLQEDNVIMLEEMWRDEEELERHLRSNEYRNVLLIMEMALQNPEILFNRISDSSGIETIERVRTATVRENRR